MKACLCLMVGVLAFIPAAFGEWVIAPPDVCGPSGGLSCTTNLGNSAIDYPFGTTGGGPPYSRQQQIFLSSDLWAEAHTIHVIAFRPAEATSSATWNINTIVNIGYTTLSEFGGNGPFLQAGSSSTFGWQTVLGTYNPGTSTYAGVPVAGSCSGPAAANNWCVMINLTTPFHYTPAPDRNLVLDLIRYNDTTNLMSFSLDASSNINGVVRVLENRGKDLPTTGVGHSARFVVSEFIEVPEPATLAMMGGGLLALGLLGRRRRRG